MHVWVLKATTEAQFSFCSENGPCVCLPPTSAVGLLWTASRNIKETGVESDMPLVIGQIIERDKGHFTAINQRVFGQTTVKTLWEFIPFGRRFWDFILQCKSIIRDVNSASQLPFDLSYTLISMFA